MNYLLLFIAVGIVVWGATIFNRLVHLRNRSQGAWADIDVQLKRRHDLVRNLVETVKGYAAHEKKTLEDVVRARTRAESARDSAEPGESGNAENHLSGQMKSLFALAEAYPDLKASDRFLDLQRALIEVENDLQNARRYYNAVVRDLNTRIQSVPDLVIAKLLGFRERDFFELDSIAESVAPAIDMQG